MQRQIFVIWLVARGSCHSIASNSADGFLVPHSPATEQLERDVSMAESPSTSALTDAASASLRSARVELQRGTGSAQEGEKQTRTKTRRKGDTNKVALIQTETLVEHKQTEHVVKEHHGVSANCECTKNCESIENVKKYENDQDVCGIFKDFAIKDENALDVKECKMLEDVINLFISDSGAAEDTPSDQTSADQDEEDKKNKKGTLNTVELKTALDAAKTEGKLTYEKIAGLTMDKTLGSFGEHVTKVQEKQDQVTGKAKEAFENLKKLGEAQEESAQKIIERQKAIEATAIKAQQDLVQDLKNLEEAQKIDEGKKVLEGLVPESPPAEGVEKDDKGE